MKPLKIGITGVRGIVGQTFTPELVVQFAQAFGSYLDGGRILICRDTRPSGPMIRSAVLAGLLAAGCEVIDLGVSPTPSMQISVKSLKADGGIAITAGHNPAAWNALKFVRGDGLYLNSNQAEELLIKARLRRRAGRRSSRRSITRTRSRITSRYSMTRSL
jgi:phosphomannomutase